MAASTDSVLWLAVGKWHGKAKYSADSIDADFYTYNKECKPIDTYAVEVFATQPVVEALLCIAHDLLGGLSKIMEDSGECSTC